MSAIIAGTYNSRDTGGMPLDGGGTTSAGVLYRSDALATPTAVGLAALADSPIGVIVDFRTDVERADAPDILPTTRAIRTRQLSVLEGAMAMPAGVGELDEAALSAMLSRMPSLAELYVGMLQHGAQAFADVARLIARPEDDGYPAVLMHCTAGKDRTGVATALLLDAAGAQRAAVVADYAASQENLAGGWADGMLAKAASWGVPIVPAITELVTATPPSAIEAALAWVDEQGGSAAYLQDGGLTQGELDGLRERIAG